jgi:F-type H+-transporting ATPase subunit b
VPAAAYRVATPIPMHELFTPDPAGCRDLGAPAPTLAWGAYGAGGLPITLLASGGVSVDIDATFLAQFVLFACFVLIMKPLMFDPLIRVFEERDRRTAGAIAEARKLDEQAVGLKHEVDQRLDGVRRDAAGHRDRLRAEAAKREAEMLAAARVAANRKVDQGKAEVTQEIARIAGQLETERHGLAATIASRVLGREVRP